FIEKSTVWCRPPDATRDVETNLPGVARSSGAGRGVGQGDDALGWQGHADGGADALAAFDAEAAAVQLDQADGERQPEAGARMLAAPGARHLAEAGDGGRDLDLVHADAVVDDGEGEPVRGLARAQQHAAAGVAEFDGV